MQVVSSQSRAMQRICLSLAVPVPVVMIIEGAPLVLFLFLAQRFINHYHDVEVT